MSTPTDADRQRAAETLTEGEWWHTDVPLRDAIAQALADERDRTLASCYGRHEPLQLVASGPGIVTCDGHELHWTAR